MPLAGRIKTAPSLGFADEGSMGARAHVGIGMTCQQGIERDRGELGNAQT